MVRPRSDFLGIKKVELRTPLRKVGKIAGCGLSPGRCQSDVNGIERIKILLGHQMNPARPGGRFDLALC